MAQKAKTLSNLTKVLFLSTLALGLASCTNKVQTVQYVEGNEAKLYSMATDNLNHGSYKKAEELLTQLTLQYPFGVYREEVQVLSAYTAFKAQKYALATADVDKYMRSPGQKTQTSYMLLVHALSSYMANRTLFQSLFNLDAADNDLGNINIAISDLQTILNQEPKSSPLRAYSLNFYNFLVNTVARHNTETAALYLKYNDPLAAQKRAYTVVYNFGNTQYLEPALNIIKKASEQVGVNVDKDLNDLRTNAAKLVQIPLVTKFPQPGQDILTPIFLKQEKK